MRFGIDNKCFVLVLLLFCLFSNACSQTKEEKMRLAKEHSDKALELIANGDAKGAIQEQLKAIELASEDSELLINLTAFYLDDKNLEKAKETVLKAIKINPDNAWGHYLYAETLNGLGEKEKALAEYLKATELDPTNASFKLNLGTLYGDLGRFEQEKNTYLEVIKIEPQNVTAIYNLGIIAERENDLNLAVKMFKEVIKIEPQNQERVNRTKDKIRKIEEFQKNIKPN